MWSLAWPWALLALPLPLLVRKLLPEATGLAEAGLKVPSLGEFSTLKDRKGQKHITFDQNKMTIFSHRFRQNDLQIFQYNL